MKPRALILILKLENKPAGQITMDIGDQRIYTRLPALIEEWIAKGYEYTCEIIPHPGTTLKTCITSN